MCKIPKSEFSKTYANPASINNTPNAAKIAIITGTREGTGGKYGSSVYLAEDASISTISLQTSQQR